MFVSKEFHNIGKVKGIDCQVLILSDLVSKDKIGCLRLETKYVSSYKSIETYRGTLDFDEIGNCLKCLYYLKDNILMSMPNVDTEVDYKSRDGVRFGAYFNEKKRKWQAFVYTKSYNVKSAEYIDSANIEELINFLETSQKVISEKTQ